MVAFETSARVLHFLHLVAGAATVASCIHLLVRAFRSGRQNMRLDKRVKLHALVLLVGYLTSFVLGAIIYPTFRVRVRAELLDKTYPWATGLFEIKEHSASIMLIPVIAIFLLSRALDSEPRADRRYTLLFGGLVGLVLVVVLYNAGVGWYLGTLRSV